MQILSTRVRTFQIICIFLACLFDAPPPAADVFQLVSKRIKNTACQKMLVRGRVSNTYLTLCAFRCGGTLIRVKTCQKKHPSGVSDILTRTFADTPMNKPCPPHTHTHKKKCEFVSKHAKTCQKRTLRRSRGQGLHSATDLFELGTGVSKRPGSGSGMSKRIETCQTILQTSDEINAMCQNMSKT